MCRNERTATVEGPARSSVYDRRWGNRNVARRGVVAATIAITLVIQGAPSAYSQGSRDLESFPYFQYLISHDGELDHLTPENAHIIQRPVVSNFWFNPLYLASEMAAYRATVPGAELGRYYVAYNATPPPIPGSLPDKMANIPDSWLLRNSTGGYFVLNYGGQLRYNLDLTKPEVRRAIVDFWIANDQSWDFIFIDHFIYKYLNVFNHCAPGPTAWYAGMLALLQEWHQRGNKPIVINAIMRPDTTWPELFPYVDGFFLESALSAIYMPYYRDRLELIPTELAAYRAALDAGKKVMITNNRSFAGVSGDEGLAQPEKVGPLLSAAVCLVRNPGDELYYNTNIMRGNDFQPYWFHEWWRRLGAPSGPLTWVDAPTLADSVARRTFSNGRVELDISHRRPLVRVTINGFTETNFNRGDVNCDGTVNTFDIDPFVAALSDDPGFAARWPECVPDQADANWDGTVNQFDILSFVSLLAP